MTSPPPPPASPPSRAAEGRVLVLAGSAEDAAFADVALREADLEPVACEGPDELLGRLDEGAGLLVCGEEALPVDDLQTWRRAQPPWADLPVVVLASRDGGREVAVRTAAADGELTLVERPLRSADLVAAVRRGLKARGRQYEARDLLARLAALDRRRDDLIAVLGHELRNPLGAAASALAVARSEGCGEAERQRQLIVVERQLRGLAGLVDDLVDLAQVTAGHVELVYERLELGDLVRRVAALPEIASRLAGRVQLHDEGPLWVEGDAVRLEQVLTNLLANALDASPEGGRIWVVLSRDGDCGEVRIADEGPGIPEPLLAHVFDPFTRLADPLAATHGGLGLGLAVARRLVERHGGAIEARSEGEDAGAEIVVRLPLVEEQRGTDGPASCGPGPAAGDSGETDEGDGNADESPQAEPRVSRLPGAPAPPASRPAPAGRVPRTAPLRVLIVEDNDDARTALVSLLRLWGCVPREAADGGRAVDLAAAESFDLALVDIGLPVIDGYEVAQRLRQRHPQGSLVLVAMTGYGQPEDRRAALAAGFDQHLVKPVAPDDLHRLVDDLRS